MTSRRTWLTRGLTSLYLLLLMGLVFVGVWQSQFSEDESQWIYTSRYLTLFAKGQFDSPEWNSYWTETQPPLARYVMGASLKSGGYNLLALNGPWDFTKEPTENETLGNKPTPEMLAWARLPMGIVSALSILLIFAIGRSVGGTAAGLGAASWIAQNLRIRDLSVRAEADGLLIFFMLTGLLLTIFLGRKLFSSSQPSLRTIVSIAAALGLVFGLGMSAKLTATVGLVALPIAMLAVLLYRWMRARIDLRQPLIAITIATAIAGVVATTLFVLLNPTLYSSPITNSIDLFHHRQIEMEQQMATYPTGALAEGLPRIVAGLQRPLFTYSVGTSIAIWLAGPDARAFGETLPLDAILVALGLAVTTWAIIASIRKEPASNPGNEQTQRIEASIVALAWTTIFFAAIVATMGLDWDRYTLPLMVFAALWAGVAIGWLVKLIAQAISRRTAGA
jgi:hypothetical protein